jgi:hypothetical protein
MEAYIDINHALQVHICFPGYIDEIRRENQERTSNNGVRVSPNLVSQVDVKFFTDKVLLPALKNAFTGHNDRRLRHLDVNFPASHSAATESVRGRNGQNTTLKKTVSRMVLGSLVANMRQRVSALSPSRRSLFESFFFFSVAHGLKEPIAYDDDEQEPGEIIRSVFSDVLWGGDLGNTFIDIGAVFLCDKPSTGTTGLWLKPSAQEDGFPHRALLQSFFGTRLLKSQYTINDFGHFKSVAGLLYVARDISAGDGDLGVRKLQVYQTLKNQFQYRASSYRHDLGSTVTPKDIWRNTKKFKTSVVSSPFVITHCI